ncbi:MULTISPECIES: ankyrin repeat domain-containing protein [Aquimarina]|uniref:ankyrin repeat domain-containing protein n=1 Tax=Aquimarina TaxID=290174 RepID=UPI000CDE94DE|nr:MULTISPECIES: ankyrin repeat domain-containing protein [Aquimarina]
MKKTIFATLLIMCVTTISFANKETKIVSDSHHNYELNSYSTSPFCMAIVKGEVEMVKKLIEYGSNVNQKSDGMTPLMYAARYNRTEIIKMLIKKGANVKTKDAKGYTAMKFAELSNAKEAIALLKEMS